MLEIKTVENEITSKMEWWSKSLWVFWSQFDEEESDWENAMKRAFAQKMMTWRTRTKMILCNSLISLNFSCNFQEYLLKLHRYLFFVSLATASFIPHHLSLSISFLSFFFNLLNILFVRRKFCVVHVWHSRKKSLSFCFLDGFFQQ